MHPFEDGNRRFARAFGDLLRVRADSSPQRFYSLSAQIQREREDYDDVLEATQKGTFDITTWLAWFLEEVGVRWPQHQL
jgi:Fic family protein